MNLDFITVLVNVSILMMLGIPGYAFRKNKMIGEGGAKPLVVLLIYVTQPFLIIMSFQSKKYTPDILSSIGAVFFMSVAIHIVLLLAGRLVFNKRLCSDKAKRGVFIFASAFSNCGYMGIPVIRALFGSSPLLSEMLIYVSVYIAVFNIVNWTVGIYIISGEKKYMSVKNALINPITFSLLIAVPLFFSGVSVEDFSPSLADAFKMLGDMTTPLSMTILGIKLAEMPLREIFNEKPVYLSVFIKLILMPLIMLAALNLFFGAAGGAIKYTLAISAAMPVATITVANAERFGGDGKTAAKCMLCSTILSVVTIPLICLLL